MPAHGLYFLDDRIDATAVRSQSILFAIPGNFDLVFTFLNTAPCLVEGGLKAIPFTLEII